MKTAQSKPKQAQDSVLWQNWRMWWSCQVFCTGETKRLKCSFCLTFQPSTPGVTESPGTAKHRWTHGAGQGSRRWEENRGCVGRMRYVPKCPRFLLCIIVNHRENPRASLLLLFVHRGEISLKSISSNSISRSEANPWSVPKVSLTQVISECFWFWKRYHGNGTCIMWQLTRAYRETSLSPNRVFLQWNIGILCR